MAVLAFFKAVVCTMLAMAVWKNESFSPTVRYFLTGHATACFTVGLFTALACTTVRLSWAYVPAMIITVRGF